MQISNKEIRFCCCYFSFGVNVKVGVGIIELV